MDRDKAIWLHLRDKETCRSCGTRHSEWDPDKGGDLYAYTAVRGHCKGCAELHQLRDQISKSSDQIPGTYASLKRNVRR